MNWPRRMSVAFFGIIAASMIILGAKRLAGGNIVPGLTDLLVAAQAAVVGIFTWLNWRILGLNRDLIEENRRLRAERRAGAVYLMPRPRHAAEEHGEPGDAP
jgi:hypothetical protein